jgi:hypothetical protein
MENNENEALEPADAQHEQCGSNPARALVAVNFRVVRDSDGMPICKAKLYCRTTDENEGNDFFFRAIPLLKKQKSLRTKGCAFVSHVC